MSKDKEHWVTKIQSSRPYRSVYQQEKKTEQRSSMDWKALAGAILIALIVIAGVVVALRSVEPTDGWTDLTQIRVTADEAFLYILLETSGQGQPDWTTRAYRIAIDTYDVDRGSRVLPPPMEASPGSGVEFMIDLRGPGESRLLVVEGYDPFDGERPIFSTMERDRPFRPLKLQTNRERFARDGRRFPSESIERGVLRFRSPNESPSGNADIATADGAFEIRIPWSLLNVTDPSTRSVIHSLERGRDNIEIRRTNGFRIYAYSFRTEEEGVPDLVDQIPTGGGEAPLYQWETWDRPTYELQPKEGLPLFAEAMNSIPDRPAPPSDLVP